MTGLTLVVLAVLLVGAALGSIAVDVIDVARRRRREAAKHRHPSSRGGAV